MKRSGGVGGEGGAGSGGEDGLLRPSSPAPPSPPSSRYTRVHMSRCPRRGPSCARDRSCAELGRREVMATEKAPCSPPPVRSCCACACACAQACAPHIRTCACTCACTCRVRTSETSTACACDTKLTVPVSRPDLPPFAQALVELCVSEGAFAAFLLALALAPSASPLRTAVRLPPCDASPRTGTGLRTSRATRTALLSDRALGNFGCSIPRGNGPCVGGAHGT